MRFVIQCVDNAEVEIDGGIVGKIGKGYLVLAGICEKDTRATADRMVEKSCLSLNLRCTQTAARETVLPLLRPVRPSMRKNSIII